MISKKQLSAVVGAIVVLAFVAVTLRDLWNGVPLGPLRGSVLALLVVSSAIVLYGRKTVAAALDTVKQLAPGSGDDGK